MLQSILRTENLFKTHKTPTGPFHALNNVTIDLYENEILALLGVNGAGKTTLSSILATLHPPTSGSVLFYGQSIYTNLMTYRQSIGFCPQNQNLDTLLTVKQNLVFAGRYMLMPEKKISNQLDQLIERFNLTQYLSHTIDKLSGGTKQRVLICRALMHNPKIVILDEPTVGLDPGIRQTLWEHIRSLKKEGISIILTTHYLDEAEALADRVCILNKGAVILSENMKNLKARHENDTLETIFLRFMREYNAASE